MSFSNSYLHKEPSMCFYYHKTFLLCLVLGFFKPNQTSPSKACNSLNKQNCLSYCLEATVYLQGEKMIFDYASTVKWQKLCNKNLRNTSGTNLVFPHTEADDMSSTMLIRIRPELIPVVYHHCR